MGVSGEKLQTKSQCSGKTVKMQLISKPVNTNVVIIFDLVIKRLIVYWVGSGTVAEALEATTDKLVTEAP
ncbi:hypothetical protein DQ356_10355 [Chryseobacterium lacus]|uniref:Uncharacterized protein n=2 Tax=Chryseobacterium lacus TaxID=2058346 RepID=A0A368MWK8_9FLAO|nr:hypothetical protein DQ356_10355 [Chryseobacterium lacus]